MELKHLCRPLPTFARLLLIVPYGIETYYYWWSDGSGWSLLIVPYGIETKRTSCEVMALNTFNRTLWN